MYFNFGHQDIFPADAYLAQQAEEKTIPWGKLIKIVTGDQATNLTAVFLLTENTHAVGRMEGPTHVVLRCKTISLQHARISKQGNVIKLTDQR